MKRKRGCPPVKSYPQPQTLREGLEIAAYGKLGSSEVMAILRHCPYWNINRVQWTAVKNRTKEGKELLSRELPHLERWENEIGVIVGQKIAAGDSEFFRQLGDALERSREGISVDFSRGTAAQDCVRFDGQIDNVRRFLAISHRLDCYMTRVPFTSKGLRDYYRRYNQNMDSSTLSKMWRWALSADDYQPRIFQAPRLKRPKNRIL
jgi:hypothetical protein